MAEALDGKVAIVTGASSGIGRAVAQELLRRGAAVVIAARSRERVDEAAAALGAGCTGVVADVTRAEDVARLIDGTIETHGRIDILVANAGVYVGGDLWESDPEALDRLLTTNVNGVVRTVRAVLPHLLERREGDILVTSSVSGHQAIHWEPVYSASKHALQAFVHGMRRQLVGTGIRIGAIAPGIVLNDLWGVSDPAEIEDKIARGEAIRSRTWLTPRPTCSRAAARHDPRPRDPAARAADLARVRGARAGQLKVLGQRAVRRDPQLGQVAVIGAARLRGIDLAVRDGPQVADEGQLVLAVVDLAPEQRHPRPVLAGVLEQEERVVGRARRATEDADHEVRVVGDQFLHHLRAVVDHLEKDRPPRLRNARQRANDHVVHEAADVLRAATGPGMFGSNTSRKCRKPLRSASSRNS